MPGIERDPAAEHAAFAKAPLPDYLHEVHSEGLRWYYERQWSTLLPVVPRLARALKGIQTVGSAKKVKATRTPASPERLTAWTKNYAAQLGLSAIGIAPYDPKYTFANYQGKHCGETVIVCVLEQNYEATQELPSARCDRAIYSTYAELMRLAAKLAKGLVQQGYRAQAGDPEGHDILIHYGVEAGLGQLGLNGQLLTAVAGSRCRLCIVVTDAPLIRDHPVDYGVKELCSACLACVERCPVGALKGKWSMKRGVLKGKLNTDRCFPTVARANNCGICMKVCPVQRYGLNAVIEEFERTGTVLKKGTDELEGYDWPLDGRHYGPGERPRFERGFFDIPSFNGSRGRGALDTATPEQST